MRRSTSLDERVPLSAQQNETRPATISRRSGVARPFRSSLLLSITIVATACYTYEPIAAVRPESGIDIEMQINDRGRVAVGERLGPEVDKIDGRLVSYSDDGYTLRVNQIQQLGGTTSPWAGETVSVKREYVKNVYERKFSKGRSSLLAASFLAGVGVFIATRSLLGIGGDEGSKGGTGGSGQ